MKSKLSKLISVILVIAILSVSFICDAFAVTESGEPQSYMIGFDSSLWQITDASDNVSITAGVPFKPITTTYLMLPTQEIALICRTVSFFR